MENFSGTKLALIHDQHILAYKRDRKPDIPFPGLWDLPGGGREGGESPIACGLRELDEEFGLKLEASRFEWQRRYESISAAGLPQYFLAGRLSDEEVGQISFGDEGETWALMKIDQFLAHDAAVPVLQDRLRHFLDART